MIELQAFTFADPTFFESIARYQPTQEYQDALNEILPDTWTTYRFDIWLSARPHDATFETQGFKIHVSAINDSAIETIRRAVPLCVEAGVPFKVAGDPTLLSFLNSKGAARGSSGKFMTIYPPTTEVFTELIQAIADATSDLEGPYILSDKRFPGSKVVFYRYGGFLRIDQLKVDGTRQAMIKAPSGDLIPDDRVPFFFLPDGVEDPFPEPVGDYASAYDDDGNEVDPETLEEVSDEAGDPNAAPILYHRFEIEEALAFTNAGGVYKAFDLKTSEPVVVKEARPFANSWSLQGGFLDATRILKHEYEMLTLLKDTGVTVRPIVFFQEWEHVYLAEEFVEGIPLRQFRANEAIILTSYLDDPERVHRFCSVFRDVALGLLNAVRVIHEHDVVLGDLSPNNIMVDPMTLQVKIIDLETAHVQDADNDELFRTWHTPGFRPLEDLGKRRVRPSDDLYAAGMSLYSMMIPVQHFFALKPDAIPVFLDRFVDAGVPDRVRDIIHHLLNDRLDAAVALLSDWTHHDGEPLAWDPDIWTAIQES